jgi:hypothetical protein
MSHATVVMVRCPTTGRELSTGLEMDAATFERLPDIRSQIKSRPHLVNARSLAGESSSFGPGASVVVHK